VPSSGRTAVSICLGFAPLAHLVLNAPPLDPAELSAIWLVCSEGADHVHVADVSDDDQYRFRAAHYGLKPLDPSIENDEMVRADFFAQTKGLRLVGTFGNWRGVPLLARRSRNHT